MLKKSWIFVLVLSMLLVVVACNNNQSSIENKSQVKETQDGQKEEVNYEDLISKATEKPVELKVYDGKEFMDLYGEKFQKKYPNFSFKLYEPGAEGGTISDLVAQGVKLDLIKVWAGVMNERLLDYELHGDISDLIKKYDFDLNQFFPSVVEHLKMYSDKGEIYSLPNAVVSTALFYNKQLFDKFGVDYPTDNMTWDEIYEVAKTMTRNDGDIQYIGLSGWFSLLANMNQLSQGYIDPKTNKATFNNENWKTYINNLARFNQIQGNEKVLALGGHFDFWGDGRVAMMATISGGDWAGASMTSIDWDIVKLPHFKERPGIDSGLLVPSFAIAKNSDHRDQAFLAAAFIASEEMQAEIALNGYASPLTSSKIRDVIGKNDPILAERNIKAIIPDKPAAPFPTNRYEALISPLLEEAFVLVAEGNADVNTALREAEEKANQIIEAAIASDK